VALAAVYMIRLYQRSMHNRLASDVESRDLTRGELAAIAPLVALIVALGVYPNFIVRRTERTTVRNASVAALVQCAKLPSRQLASTLFPLAKQVPCVRSKP
jgi:NADH:ubiquinone oxidoreductase subunit 4 (subunit M)